jgi:dsRNA-specific ribonuclease
MSLEPVSGIYLGDRGIAFKKLILSLLKKGNLKEKYIDILTTRESMEIYASAFTSEQVDENNNYQVYEQLGDLTGNKFIVFYIYKRFPQLRCAKGVKVAARLRINLGSKNSFCSIAENFGFWDFISATNELRQRKKKPLLEDVFEAFLGATETIIDEKTKIGNGYACVFKILSAIFDEINISLNYEDLYDAKTRLKELFDIFSDKLGPLRYEERREDMIAYSMIYRLDGAKYETRPDGTVNTNSIVGSYRKVLIGQGSAALKADAEQIAATDALKNLALQGFVKYAPAIYATFSEDYEKTKTTEQDILKIIGKQEDINNLFPTRGKSKYQTKYTSTALSHYCRQRDFSGIKNCIKMGANPNIKDSEGLSSLDILLIGKTDKKFIYKVLNRFFKETDKLDIHKNILERYYNNYKDDIFVKLVEKFNIIS